MLSIFRNTFDPFLRIRTSFDCYTVASTVIKLAPRSISSGTQPKEALVCNLLTAAIEYVYLAYPVTHRNLKTLNRVLNDEYKVINGSKDCSLLMRTSKQPQYKNVSTRYWKMRRHTEHSRLSYSLIVLRTVQLLRVLSPEDWRCVQRQILHVRHSQTVCEPSPMFC